MFPSRAVEGRFYVCFRESEEIVDESTETTLRWAKFLYEKSMLVSSEYRS